ncbi:DNA-directed RNA polymerase III subunit RPC4 [Arabidopsis suecica]|uniref:DNA-directed RNA polymerase III subunit RPC4 n=1 Tax=Arabidopsis suecica TaxID=45249 RepID=A0A8T1Z9K7_ARASU|nr:DNA-directed RNA polymerase III subunit RPC4 [Arabidopsis suecica]
MEQKPPVRKMKFAPKAPPKRVPKPEVKPEVVENDSTSAQASELLRRVNERSLRKPKADKKVPASRVAWMGGVVNSTRSNKYLSGSNGAYGSTSTQEIEYKEPWDYYSYYPITLPMRRPYAGDPEVLDVEEFMQAAGNHEDSLNTAANLGLMEDSGEQKMLFMRLPSVPLASTPTENRETKPNIRGPVQKTVDLKALPEGFMGKLLVYKSGAVKMKLGEVLYDVSPGLKSEFAQDVMVVNTEQKNCCLVGDVYKHAVLTPDIDSILKNIENM